MDRRNFLVVPASLLAWIGCTRPEPTLEYPVGRWDREKVEAWFKADGWQEIHLTEDSKWKYSGTGTAKDGTTWSNVTVTQFEDGLEWNTSDDNGHKASGSFHGSGSGPVPKKASGAFRKL